MLRDKTKKAKSKFLFDLDNTVALRDNSLPYEKLRKFRFLTEQICEARVKFSEIDFEIHTARKMKTFDGDIEKIKNHTLPKISLWLKENNLDFTNVHVGKPYCGENGLYIDDRNLTLRSFQLLTKLIAL